MKPPKKKSNFEKGIELVCQKFDVAAEKEIDWGNSVLFNALLAQWPRFHVVISSCFVHNKVEDRLVTGLNVKETYLCTKHKDES